jgi:hypothetical protein
MLRLGSHTHRVRIVLALVLLMLLPVASADAQDPGVFIDPGAPSAKEYALPLESERRLADPDQGPSAPIVPGARTSPTFGEGITSGKAPGSRGESAGSGKARRGGGAAQERAIDADAAVIRAATTNPGAPSGGAGTTLTIAGIGLGVLFVGGATGLLWRRRA